MNGLKGQICSFFYVEEISQTLFDNFVCIFLALLATLHSQYRADSGPVSAQYMCLYNGIIMAHYWQHHTSDIGPITAQYRADAGVRCWADP